MSFAASVAAALAALGSAPATVVQSVVGETTSLFNGVSSQVNANLTVVMNNYSDPDVVKEECTKTKMIANLPPVVAALVSAIPAAAAAAASNSANVLELSQLVASIKAQL